MRTLSVESGRVNCPRPGDIDVDHCVGCPDLRAVGDGGDHEVIECAAWSGVAGVVQPVRWR